ncbi:MAG: hypothetical protein RLY14_3017 [Planctomycetota bacterium]|jgi:uncharacterized protein (UPF0276 family)
MLFSKTGGTIELGVGLSWRPEFARDVHKLVGKLDFLEIIVDEWGGHLLTENCERILGKLPTVLHSATCSLGSTYPGDATTAILSSLCDHLEPRWVTEHISYSQAGEYEVNNFLPVRYEDDSAVQLAANTNALSRQLAGRRVALENTCYFFNHPGSAISEKEFLIKLACNKVPIMLDINNLYVNSCNFRYDPMEFIRLIGDACEVAYLHVAGHRESGGWLLDSHDVAVSDVVWDLALEAIKLTSAEGIVIERDHNSASIQEIQCEIERARSVWTEGRQSRESKS